MPVRIPGSTMTVLTRNHLSVISRRAARSRGTTDATAMPVTVSVDLDALQVEELGEQQGHLVGGPFGVGGDAPVVEQVVRAADDSAARGREHPDHRLGVADVDGEEHL